MGPKILVVDDSMMARRQVALALSTAGFNVLEATDGIEALQRLNQHPEVRVVVTDLHMQRMNGYELLETVRQSDAMQKVSVIILTSETEPELMHRAKALGAKGWIVKPFKPDLLLAAVKRLTNQLAG